MVAALFAGFEVNRRRADAERQKAERALTEKQNLLNTMQVPLVVVKRLGIRTAIVKKATEPRALPPLSGSLAIDTNYLSRVHSRFAGEVVSVGTTADNDAGELVETRVLKCDLL